MASEDLDLYELKSGDGSVSAATEENVEPMDQQETGKEPATQQLDDSVFVLSRTERSSIVSKLAEASSILQGDETVNKDAIGDEIEDLLLALSRLPFKPNNVRTKKDDANPSQTLDKTSEYSKNCLVFYLTRDERSKIVGQLINLKSYAVVCTDSVSSKIKTQTDQGESGPDQPAAVRSPG